MTEQYLITVKFEFVERSGVIGDKTMTITYLITEASFAAAVSKANSTIDELIANEPEESKGAIVFSGEIIEAKLVDITII